VCAAEGDTPFLDRLPGLAGKAVLQLKFLLWSLKPAETPLSNIAAATVDTAVDRASGLHVCNTMVVMRSGVAWALPASGKKKAEANAAPSQ
jgi:hypothetical protein